MTQSPNQQNMTNPPATQTEMKAPAVKMTKVRVLQGIFLDRLGRIVNPGTEMEMTPEEVEEFCNKRFKGPYSFDGEKSKKNATRSMIRRAIPMTEVREIEAKNAQIAALRKESGEDADVGEDEEAS